MASETRPDEDHKPPRIEAAPADYVTAIVDNSTGQNTAEGT